MGLQNTAHYLKSKGRGRDTELVHMSPTEIKGLQALALAHGGSLTINPSTGLPEAGFLEDILPVVAAAGLTYLTAGAAAPMLAGTLGATGAGIVAGAGAGALISGGMAAVQGKDVGQAALMGAVGGGFSGGMGAYGDANVFGVGAAPTDAVTQTTQASLEAASTLNPASVNPAGYNVAMPNSSGAGFINPESGLPMASPANILEVTDEMATRGALGRAVDPGISLAEGQKTAGPTSYYSKLKPENYIQKAAILGLPALGVLQADQNMPGEQDDEYTRRLKGYKLSPNYKAYEAPRPNPYYRPTYAAEGGVMNSFDDSSGMDEPAGLAQGNLQKGLFGLGYADGGIARYKNKGEVNVLQDYLDRQDREEAQKQKHLSTNPSSYFPNVGIFRDPDVDTARKDALTAAMIRLGKAGKGAGIKTMPLPKTSIKGLGDIRGATPEIEEAAKGGVMSHLGGYSDGGRMLKGPGDGMSDSIPASIAGKQPARLADGEFVVPADVVSHLGNGSTDAGAKKLYKMMDKIRQARTGKKKQAPQVNVDKYLPMGKASGGITGYAEGGVIGYANGGTTYSDQQVLNAIKESMAQGFSLEESKEGAKRLGVTDSQLYKAAALLQPTPINTPVTTTQTPQTYSDQRILDAIKESLAQGVGLEDTKNALRTRYGVDDAQLYRVADLYNQPTTTTQTPVTPVTPTPPTDAQNIKTRVQDAYNKGFSSAQIGAALIRSGVSQAQALQATGLDQNTISQIYTGGAALGNADIGAPAGNFMFDASGKAITTEQRAAAQQAAAQKAAEQKFNEDASKSIAAYRPSFVPRVSGINMSSTMQDPYSDVGLKSLYEQMMGQYKAPTPPMSDTDIRTFAQNFARDNPGKGAELGQALINKGIPVNQAIAATGLSPGTVNTAYIGGQALGTAAPPTLNTQYNYSDPGTYYRPAPVNNLVLQNPITDAVTAEANQAKADAVAAANAVSLSGDPGGNRAGGLMSIDRKKRAKPKYKT